MQRTTIFLDEALDREIRKLSTKENRSLKDLITDLLRKGLQDHQNKPKQSPVFVWHTSKGMAAPGFDPSNRDTYLDLIHKKNP